MRFNGREITLLTCHGIEVLFELMRSAAQRGVLVTLDLSPAARKVLDLVGLWWLGVVSDGLQAPEPLPQALSRYAELAYQGVFSANGPDGSAARI